MRLCGWAAYLRDKTEDLQGDRTERERKMGRGGDAPQRDAARAERETDREAITERRQRWVTSSLLPFVFPAVINERIKAEPCTPALCKSAGGGIKRVGMISALGPCTGLTTVLIKKVCATSFIYIYIKRAAFSGAQDGGRIATSDLKSLPRLGSAQG